MLQLSAPSLGDLSGFQLAEVPDPQPGPGQVRIRVDACALGYVDVLIALGRYQMRPQLPHVPGGEIAGVVDCLGPGVTSVSVGDRVLTWQLGGGLAEFVVVAADEVERSPSDISSDLVAASVIDYPTAYYALLVRGQLKPFETVLVLGASGGVGAAAIQLARRAGANVIAACSTNEKRQHALELGAHAVVDYTAERWRDNLRQIVPQSGLDVVVDPVGGSASEAAFRSLGKGGRHLVIGFAGGGIPKLPMNLPLIKSASLVGVDLRQYLATEPVEARVARARIFQMLRSGDMKIPMAERLNLLEAPRALSLIQQRDRIGKVIVGSVAAAG